MRLSRPDEPIWMAHGGLISDHAAGTARRIVTPMSFITKRRLASLASASALVATMAVAVHAQRGPRGPELIDWPFDQQRVQLDPQQSDRECPELRVRGLLPSKSSATPSLWAERRRSFRRCPSSSPAGRASPGPGTRATPSRRREPRSTCRSRSTSMTNNGGAKGALLATKTQTVAMAYRPSTQRAAAQAAAGTTRRTRPATTA